MFTKAIVYSKLEAEPGIYRYRVWVPLLWGAYSGRPKEQDDSRLLTASVCDAQGAPSNYAEGDVVYVAFEDDILNRPVILGCLSGRSTNKRSDKLLSLNVESQVTLPKQTSVGETTQADLQALQGLGEISSLARMLALVVDNLNSLLPAERRLDLPESWNTFLNEGEVS